MRRILPLTVLVLVLLAAACGSPTATPLTENLSPMATPLTDDLPPTDEAAQSDDRTPTDAPSTRQSEATEHATQAGTVDAGTAVAQRRRFSEQVGDSYDATVSARCFCPDAEIPVRVEVRDGVVTRATRVLAADGSEDITDALAAHTVVTVDAIHASIVDVAAGSEGEVRAVYDGRGVPVSADIDHVLRAVDDEIAYTVTDVTISTD